MSILTNSSYTWRLLRLTPDLCPGVENGEYFVSAPTSSDYHSDLSSDQDHSPRGRQLGAGQLGAGQLGAGRQLSVDRAGRPQPRQARVVADYSRKHFTEVISSSWHIYISYLTIYISNYLHI